MICVTFGLTGCGEQEVVPVTEPTLEVLEDGQLLAWLVEDFDKDYYNLSELDTMVREEAEAYNEAARIFVTEAGQVPVTVQSVAMAEDGSKKVIVGLLFANSRVYEDYFETDLFYGTVAEAAAAGYELSAALTSVKDGSIFTNEDVEKNSKRNILIMEDSVVVRCAGKVLYIGNNASLTEEGFVDCSQSEGIKLIITK